MNILNEEYDNLQTQVRDGNSPRSGQKQEKCLMENGKRNIMSLYIVKFYRDERYGDSGKKDTQGEKKIFYQACRKYQRLKEGRQYQGVQMS